MEQLQYSKVTSQIYIVCSTYCTYPVKLKKKSEKLNKYATWSRGLIMCHVVWLIAALFELIECNLPLHVLEHFIFRPRYHVVLNLANSRNRLKYISRKKSWKTGLNVNYRSGRFHGKRVSSINPLNLTN